MKLSALCQKIGSGATPKGGSTVYVSQGVSLIRSQNVYNNQFEYGGLCHITDEAARKLDSVTVQEGDVLLNITGDSVARCAIVPGEVLPARVNQHVAIIRPKKDLLDNRFLMYYLTSPRMQALMLGVAVGKGASRNALTKGMIENFDFPCLSIVEQRKIVNILAPYDSLIENNRRQIKLLEETAQRLYKEWFVDLRFPGHEHTPIVNGIPQGWKMARFGDEIDYVRGRSYSSKELSDKGECLLINLKNIRSHGGYLPGGEKGYIGEYKTEQCAHLGDLIMSVTDMTHERRLVGHVALVPQLKSTAIISMDLIKLIPRAFPVSYIYSVFNYGKLDEQAAQYANGTNVLHLKPSCLADLEFVSPPNAILEKYDDFFCALMGMMNALYAENASLTEARDCLLPKLMSGEVEV